MTCLPWPIAWPCDTASVSNEFLSIARDGAQEILWAMSGRQYGVCEVTERYTAPVTDRCQITPYLGRDGYWRNSVGGAVARCCSIRLAHTPVRAIREVIVGGQVQSPASYLREGNRLLRVGGDCWPGDEQCGPSGIEVTYSYGRSLPAITPAAMGEVGCEILQGLTTGLCKLPSRAVSFTRQGVTVDLAELTDLAARKRLGLPIADRFLDATNPASLPDRSSVHSPDVTRRTV